MANTTHCDDSLATSLEGQPGPSEERLEPVAAPYVEFSAGLQAVRGYRLDEDGDSLSLAFEPWFVESENPLSVPCVRIVFHRVGDRILLDSFVIEDADETRSVNIDAAHDALQAWMDYISDSVRKPS